MDGLPHFPNLHPLASPNKPESVHRNARRTLYTAPLIVI